MMLAFYQDGQSVVDNIRYPLNSNFVRAHNFPCGWNFAPSVDNKGCVMTYVIHRDVTDSCY